MHNSTDNVLLLPLLNDDDKYESQKTGQWNFEVYSCFTKNDNSGLPENRSTVDNGCRVDTNVDYDNDSVSDEEREYRVSFYDITSKSSRSIQSFRSGVRRKKPGDKKDYFRNHILKRSITYCHDLFIYCSWVWARQCLSRLLPCLGILKGYSALYDLPCDLIAGLTVGIMHIPQGMAYALLARLPPVYGLYTSFYPVLVYFVFGTSRHISVGTFAVVSLMVGAVVEDGHVSWERQHRQDMIHNLSISSSPMANGLPTVERAINIDIADRSELDRIKLSYAMSATFAVGVMQIFFGLIKMGFLTTFLSDPLISGFTTGAAVHVLSSQLHSIFGVPVGQYSGSFKLLYGYRDFFVNLNKVNYVTMTASVSAMLVLVLVRDGINNNKKQCHKLRIPIPIELVVIIVATLLSYYLEIHKEFHVEIIGHIPKGLPKADFSVFRYIPEVLGEAFAICFTATTLSFAIAKILADKHGYVVDPNQELLAFGVSNTIGSIFSCFCSSASLSRSVVQEEAGGKTQLASVVAALLILIVLILVGPLFEPLPNCILASIIVVSLKRLFLQFAELLRLWKVSKIDFTVWIVVFTNTVILDVDLGLLIGLIFNLIPILLRTQRPYVCLLGNIDGTDLYVDVKVHKKAKQIAGVKIFRFEAPLYFANVHFFRQSLAAETGLDLKELQSILSTVQKTDLRLRHDQVCLATTGTWPDEPCEARLHLKQEHTTRKAVVPAAATDHVFSLVVDTSTIQYIDSVTARVLREMILDYKDVGIEMYLGECKPEVRWMLDKSGFYMHVPRRNVCATIHHAVCLAIKDVAFRVQDLPNDVNDVSDSFVNVTLDNTS